MKTNRKLGFGLIEVIAASLVLGFLVIALTRLQLGNRESILRIRARDAANFVANHVLDSIAATGMKAIEIPASSSSSFPAGCTPAQNLIYCNPNYEYYFEGKHGNATGVKVKNAYKVEVFEQEGTPAVPTQMVTRDTSLFTKTTAEKENKYSKSLSAVVSWDFKNSTQSISMDRRVK